MLIAGGTISSGRLNWVSPCGAYWISWNSGFWKTTWPGVVARLTPTSKAPLSHWRSLPSCMSLARCSRPLNRLAPWVATARSRASGLLFR
ncbi:hypothetical protein D3C81_1751390 [compost metagenome]